MILLRVSLVSNLCSGYLIIMLTIYLSVSALLPMKEEESVNRTSCEEFLNNSKLDLVKLVEEDWKIFYLWNDQHENSYNIRFSTPSPMLVQRFEAELAKELKPPVNFSHAELFMETAIDFSALYIKSDTPGLYRLIPNVAFEMKTIPKMKFALKIVEPGYLGIMNCKYRLCYALAPVQSMPKPDEILQAAEKIGFRSDLGRSYLVKEKEPEVPREVPAHEEDDAQDEVDEAVEMKENELSIF